MGLGHSPSIVLNGLIAYYDAGNPRSYPGSGSTWFDISGRGNHLTLTSATYSSARGGQLTFSGGTSGATTSSFSGLSGSQAHTVETFFQTNAVSGNRAWPLALGQVSTNGLHWLLNTSGTGQIGGYGTQSLTKNPFFLNPNPLFGTTWSHIVTVYDGTNLSCYLNGELFSSLAVTLNYTGNLLSIAYPQNGESGHNSNWSTVRIYNRALSQAEIRQNFNASEPKIFGPRVIPNTHYPSDSLVRNGLVLNLEAFNTFSYSRNGIIWNDISGFNNSGTLINGPTYDSGNSSIAFDGVNDWAYGSSSAITLSNQITLSAWIRHNTVPGSIQRYLTVGVELACIRHDGASSAGQLHFYTSNGSFGNFAHIRVNNQLVINQWYHVTATYDGTTMNLYKNATLIGTTTTNNTYPAGTQEYSVSAGSPESLNGNIGQALVYNRVLSQNEITQNYNYIRNRFGL